MKSFYMFVLTTFIWLAPLQQATAQEIFVGVAAHEVDTPLSMKIGEEGVDLQVGYRGKRIEALSAIGAPSPYIFASINSAGDTSLIAAGLSWKIGTKFYLRPGIGLAIHDGPSLRFAPDGSQTQLGSRILFEPELAIGVQLSERIDLEASWVHVSHAQLFNGNQNPGLDIIGARLVIKLP
ncbi:acyloxyacyl hydrolase [Parasphingorhabdus cellanae]|uniref:Acyloxyacyl hydrolase n=1 Tax=Parasphingorhabdus cellanae TaxID=2806553 RepID=A0ABX7T202_9SPHN|nr:acyloxyacyl hydrolase [Parasphingorhabdus cellanae]QTD54978.1 acyloxyacyl hydrolase [Parasphingorhabdus cellanae]